MAAMLPWIHPTALAETLELGPALEVNAVGVDLLVPDWQNAERMAGSRWLVMGEGAQEGKVLDAA